MLKQVIYLTCLSVLMASPTFAFWKSKCKVDTQGNFDVVIHRTRDVLEKKRECAEQFDSYFSNLITIAKGYPANENKQRFSEFLVWSSDAGIVTRQHAEELYNRYFTIKFLALMGDYNLCSSVCANEDSFRDNLERELADKEVGLLKICRDGQSFSKANQLFSDSLTVVGATCRACAQTAQR